MLRELHRRKSTDRISQAEYQDWAQYQLFDAIRGSSIAESFYKRFGFVDYTLSTMPGRYTINEILEYIQLQYVK